MSLQLLFPMLPDSLPVAGAPALSSDDDFEVLALALDAAGLTGTVAGLEDTTIFAPTDAAFAGLATALGYDGDPDDADAVFGAIAGALTDLSEDGDPIPLLTDILLYHVSPDEQDAADLNAAGPITTLLDGAGFEVNDGTIIDNDSDATNADIVVPDVAAGSNTLQVVDQVLLPVPTPVEGPAPTLLGTLQESGGSFDDNPGDFDLLLTALQATGLDVAADDPEADVTVFVPTDGAFVSLAQGLGYDGDDEGEAFQAIVDASAAADPEDPLALVTDILTYHISPGTQDAEAVLGAEEIATLNGETIGVMGTTLVDQDPDAPDPTIVATDIEASNGIAHVIDEILLPIDLPQEDDDDMPSDPVDDDDGFDIAGALLAFGLFGALAYMMGG